MPIITNLQSINSAAPDVFLLEVTPNPTVVAQGNGVVGTVGQSTYGPVNQSTEVFSVADFLKKFGEYSSTSGLDGVWTVYNILRRGAPKVKFVRVCTGATASLSLTGSTTGDATVTLTALYPGTGGNLISGVVTGSQIAGYFDVVISRGNQTREYKLSNLTSTDAAAYLVDRINQDPMRLCVAAIGTGTATGLANRALVAFSGGTDGAMTGTGRTAAYVGSTTTTGVTGNRVLDADDEVNHVVSCLVDTTMNGDIVSMCQPSPYISPRSGYIGFTAGANTDTVKGIMTGINTDFVKTYYNGLTIYNPFSKAYEYVPPQILAAGANASVAVQKSLTRLQIIDNIISGEYVLSNAQVGDLLQYRINCITLLPNYGWVFRSDVTASANNKLAQGTRRQIVNYLSRALVSGLQFLVGKNHTEDLRATAKSTVESFLADCARNSDPNVGPILASSNGSRPYVVICDSSNNPPETVAQNKLFIDVIVSIPATADKIVIRLDADIENVRVSA